MERKCLMASRTMGTECKGNVRTGLGFGKRCMKMIDESGRQDSEPCLAGLRSVEVRGSPILVQWKGEFLRSMTGKVIGK